MDKALLDTDHLSEYLKGKNPLLGAKAAAYRKLHGRLTVSVVTVLEVVKGLRQAGREDALERFVGQLPTLEVITLDVDTAILAGKIYGDLERSGQPIGRADPMIAATALRLEWTLVSGNTKHFERIPPLGYPLKLDVWTR